MKPRRSPTEDERILRALARESAELPTPAVDWDHVESQLWKSIGGERPPMADAHLARSTSPSTRWSWVGALGIAAAVALAWWAQTPTRNAVNAVPTSLATAAARAVPLVRNGAGVGVSTALHTGDIVDSPLEIFQYQVAGVVSFTLEPGSAIEVLAFDAPQGGAPTLTLELQRGTIHAEVVHRNEGEAFGVEVGRTRVAVHGTSFSVTREGDRALVDVTHGSVAVGPVGHRGTTQGWLVVGPDRASFSLDGATDVRWLGVAGDGGSSALTQNGVGRPERSDAITAPPVPFSKPLAAAPRSSTNKVPRPELAPREQHAGEPAPALETDRASNPPSVSSSSNLEQQSPEAIERTQVAAILQKLGACYNKQAASLGMRFSVETTLTLTLYPNGSVRQGVFDPPLSPTLMRCATDAVNEARFAASSGPTELRLPVHLSQSSD